MLYLGAGLICMISSKLLFNHQNAFVSDNPKIIPHLFKFQFLNSYEHTIKLSKYRTSNSIKFKEEDNSLA